MNSKRLWELKKQNLASDGGRPYIYGFPIVGNMRIQYSYFADQESPEYKKRSNDHG